MAITGSEARARLFPLIEQVTKDGVPIEIVTRAGTAVLISKEEYDALEETAHLLRSPANAARLMRSLADAEAGNVQLHELSKT
jgi:antitoxin YefM